MDLRLNVRISHGPHKGTIRYIGPVAPSPGLWLGIEWDDPTRGKHSGTSADGTRYFDVRIPGSGSFVRPSSTKLSSGCCFVEALKTRYDPSAVEEVKKTEEGRQYSRKNIAEIEIETPNLERVARKAARLDRLKEVGLDGQSALEEGDEGRYEVARAFDEGKGFGPGSIRDTCPNIRWLDLSRSLLPDWEEVSLIAGELEHVKTLVLRFNRLQSPPAEVPTSWKQRLGHVQDLRLDGTLGQWEEVVRLAPALNGLKTLHLGGNELSSLAISSTDSAEAAEQAETIFPSLTHLSLEDNALSSWAELVTALSPLPALESLILDRNCITDITSAPPSARKLPRLKEIHLRGNSLRSWSSLENISQWLGAETRLEALHISNLQAEDDDDGALTEGKGTDDLLSRYEYRDFRAVAIARLPTLTVLDKTEITPKERRDAELFTYTRIRDGDAYILHGGLSRLHTDEKLHLSESDKVANFPRFLELQRLFDDELTTQSTVEAMEKGRSTLRSKMLTLSVVACDAPPSVTPPHLAGVVAQREAVQVLASTPLRLCRGKLASASGCKVGQVGAVWALMKQGSGEEEERIVLEIDDMSRSLDWYEVASGDTLVLVVEA